MKVCSFRKFKEIFIPIWNRNFNKPLKKGDRSYLGF